MVRRNDPTIDEEALRQAIGRVSRRTAPCSALGKIRRQTMNRLRHRKPLHPKRASRAVGACVCLITSKPSCV